MKSIVRATIAVSLFLASAFALATEARLPLSPAPVPTTPQPGGIVTATGGGGGAGGTGTGGSGGGGGSSDARTFALSYGAAANARTCLTPVPYTPFLWRDVACDLREGGAPKAAALLHCDKAEVRRVLALTGELRCPAEPAAEGDPYIRMRTQ